jgi:DNA-directed RNA polymerase subunit RPC12/RpoP
MQFTCSRCGGLIETQDSMGGTEVRCPHCQKGISVPYSERQKRIIRRSCVVIGIIVIVISYTSLGDSGPLHGVRSVVNTIFSLIRSPTGSAIKGKWKDVESGSTIYLGAGGYFNATSPLSGTFEGKYEIVEQSATQGIYRIKFSDSVRGIIYNVVQVSSDGTSSEWEQEIDGTTVSTTWLKQ